MYLRDDEVAILVKMETYRNLREVGYHLSDRTDTPTNNPRQFAIRSFVYSYIDKFDTDFVESDNGKYVYVGSAPTKCDIK